MYQKRMQRKLMRKKKRITFFIGLFLFSTFALPLINPTVLEAHTPKEYIAVIVEDGDSLWKIAMRFADKQTDIRHYINLIQEHNEMKTVDIYPGEVIKVPLYVHK
ncbi:MAG: cell division suppressor protein YneA [Peptococcia bacterium]|jgi:hypothetical protein